MVDLHTHTDESDGSLSPEELLDAAAQAGITTLAITDHDTFAGHEKAAAAGASLRLIRGIELNTRHGARSVHLLGYFPQREPGGAFVGWLDAMLTARRDRNQRLIDKLCSLGFDIQLSEVEALGRTLTGRPHFARVLVEKGYAANREEAFSDLIGETGRAFVDRDSPTLTEAIRMINEAGGVSSLAHPVRLNDSGRGSIAAWRAAGLGAIEVYHTDQSEGDIARFQALASQHGLEVTGGSDFHGSYKPGARLGHAANGRIPVPESVLRALEMST